MNNEAANRGVLGNGCSYCPACKLFWDFTPVRPPLFTLVTSLIKK